VTTLSCRNLAKDCLDTFSAVDASAIQKVFLAHIYAKHAQQWKQLSKQYRSVSLVTMRNRFLTEEAKTVKVDAAA
jgi:hypothetical protein